MPPLDENNYVYAPHVNAQNAAELTHGVVQHHRWTDNEKASAIRELLVKAPADVKAVIRRIGHAYI